MKRWENGKYIELTAAEVKEIQQRAALAAAEEAKAAAEIATCQTQIEQLRQKAKERRISVDDLNDLVLAVLGDTINVRDVLSER